MTRQTFLLSFDVDCGELIPGHRFIARGLSDAGELDVREFGLEGEADPLVPGFSLEYELTPGLPESARDDFFRYLVGVSYTADVPLPGPPADGGAIAPFEGGAATHGSRGSWVLPREATLLTFTLTGIDPGTGMHRAEPAGDLLVDLELGAAQWRPRP